MRCRRQEDLLGLRAETYKVCAIANVRIKSPKSMKSGDVMTLQGSPLTAVVASSDVQVNGAHVKRADPDDRLSMSSSMKRPRSRGLFICAKAVRID
jgi:hypothetical protein